MARQTNGSSARRVKMRALVTGSAGFIGSHLTEALLAEGAEVVGVDCFSKNYNRAVKLRNLEPARESHAFRFVEADVSRDDLLPLLAECDVVFHLAAEPGVRTSWGPHFETYERNNVLATQRLLEAAKERPERRFVYASSSSVYGQAEQLPTPEETTPKPFSPYGVTKLAAEHLCQLYRGNYGIATVILRYFSVYGPRQRPDMAFHRFCRAAVANEPLTVFGDGTQTRDFTFVSDAIFATKAAATVPGIAGEIYNVGGGAQISLNTAIEVIREFVGRPLETQRAGPERGDVRSTGADTSRARAELGFAPAVTLQDGLRAEFDWIRESVRPGIDSSMA